MRVGRPPAGANGGRVGGPQRAAVAAQAREHHVAVVDVAEQVLQRARRPGAVAGRRAQGGRRRLEHVAQALGRDPQVVQRPRRRAGRRARRAAPARRPSAARRRAAARARRRGRRGRAPARRAAPRPRRRAAPPRCRGRRPRRPRRRRRRAGSGDPGRSAAASGGLDRAQRRDRDVGVAARAERGERAACSVAPDRLGPLGQRRGRRPRCAVRSRRIATRRSCTSEGAAVAGGRAEQEPDLAGADLDHARGERADRGVGGHVVRSARPSPLPRRYRGDRPCRDRHRVQHREQAARLTRATPWSGVRPATSGSSGRCRRRSRPGRRAPPTSATARTRSPGAPRLLRCASVERAAPSTASA